MDELILEKDKDSFTSLELVDLINKFREQEGSRAELLHKDFLKVIRDELEEDINGRKISLVTYKDKKGEDRPMFLLNLKQARQVLLRESKFVRRAVIEYIDRLEEKLKEFIPKTYSQALYLAAQKQEQIEKLELENKIQNQQILEMTPKVSYYEDIIKSQDAVAISVIAKDYGMSAIAFNKMLYKYGIQYKQGHIWLLYDKYAREHYTKSNTIKFIHKDGTEGSRIHTKWTQKGRLFLYNFLKEKNVLPLIEQEDNYIGDDYYRD